MKNNQIKSLVLTMTYDQAQEYCNNHPKWKIPNLIEAQEINRDQCDHYLFWISDTLHNRHLIYNKLNFTITDNNKNFKNHVVLIENKEAK